MTFDESVAAGLAAETAGELETARGLFTSFLHDPDPGVAANARFHLLRIAWKQGRIDDSLALCEETRDVAIQLRDDTLRAKVENAVGVLRASRGEYAQARAAYGVAFELTKDVQVRAKILLNIGVIANIQGSFDEARRSYSRSRALFQEAGDPRGEAMALHNIGMLHADLKEWDEAEDAFRDALAFLEEQHNRQMIASILMNRSEVSYGRGRLHEGIAQCDLALTMYAELGDEAGRGETLRWKGHGLRLLARYDEADRALAESMRIAERTRNRLLEAEVTLELGRVRIGQGGTAEGRSLLEQALAMLRELGAKREVDELVDELRQR